jgi:hypothetical protein
MHPSWLRVGEGEAGRGGLIMRGGGVGELDPYPISDLPSVYCDLLFVDKDNNIRLEKIQMEM